MYTNFQYIKFFLKEMNLSIPTNFGEDKPLISSNEGESTILILQEWPMDWPNL